MSLSQPVEMMEQGDSINIRQYVALLWHWAWLLALVMVVAGAAALIISTQVSPVYSAKTTVLINEAPANKTGDYTSVITSERLARTYALMMTKQPFLAEVSKRLNLNMDLEKLSKNISVSPTRDTQLVQVTVESNNPYQAAQIANTLVVVFSETLQAMETARYTTSKQNLQTQLNETDQQIRTSNTQLAATADTAEKQRLEAKIAQYRQIYSSLLLTYEQVRLSEAQSTSSIVQVEPASVPLLPVRPDRLLNTALAAALGLLLAVCVILAVEALDDTIKSPDDVTNKLGLPVLAVIARHNAEDGKPHTEVEPRSPVSEAFRTLRTNVQYTSVDRQLTTIVVTSPSPHEGKTTIAINLAIVLAQSGRNVTVVDGDMRRPTVHRKLGLNNHNGLSSLFVRTNTALNGVVRKTNINGLGVITSGHLPPNPSELLGSQKMRSILDSLKTDNEVIVIDTPPALGVTDAAVLAPFVDGVILVIKPLDTKLPIARQAVEQLRRVGGNVLGVVMNDVETTSARYRYYYYRGYQGYEYYSYSGERKEAKGEAHRSLPGEVSERLR